ncbi:hypothetical protein OROGR_001183 [Orobanche gracilis]
MSGLSKPELKQVIVDSKRQGYIGFTEFVTAMKLISMAQEGHELSSDIVKSTGGESESSIDGRFGCLIGTNYTSLSAVTAVVDGLKILYNEKLKPLEASYCFNDFVSPVFDFDAKPMVMLLGQYSTGKTTFIKHLLQCNYPGGPEPTTDWFIVVMSGPDERSIPGNTVAVQATLPFTGLTTFGGSFLSKFECSQMQHPFISFNDKPVNEAAIGPVGKELFKKEQDDLLLDLIDIPKRRKLVITGINEFVKRARAVKIHAYIISHLKKEMPTLMGKAKAQKRLIENLENVFGKVQQEYHLPAGGFPDVEQFREVLGRYNIDKFEKLKPKMIQVVDDMLGFDISELLKNFRNMYD